jgi:Phage portal protein, SPP1 Gp6-like
MLAPAMAQQLENTAPSHEVFRIMSRGLKELAARQPGYAKLKRYYEGDHDLSYATQKLKNAFGELFRTFSDNLCPAVVDGFADNLRVENFKVEEGDTAESDRARQVWHANFMEHRAGDLHRELIQSGDAYVIVWVDAQAVTEQIDGRRAGGDRTDRWSRRHKA